MAKSPFRLVRIAVPFIGAVALGLSGCYATATTDPLYVEADYVPPNIDVYPHTTYEGRVVYLVNDHWYTREGGHWVYYRSEPKTLYRQRAVVQRAPRAPDHDDRHRDHHARDRNRRDIQEAPPAMPRY
jgi:hypothetical protein